MINKVVEHGYLARDPELKTYNKQDGTAGDLANFTIGVSRPTGDETDWFNCTVFGKRAKVVEKYFRKGSQILVTGRLETSKYEKNGMKLTSFKIIVDDFDFCDRKEAGTRPEPEHDAVREAEEEIPF